MELRKVLTLRGPNLWTTSSALEAWIDSNASERETFSTESARTRLVELCTALHGECGTGCQDGTQPPFHLETELPRLIGRIANEFQGVISGSPAVQLLTAGSNEPSLNKIILGYDVESFARECLEAAYHFCAAVVSGEVWDVTTELNRLKQCWAEARPTPLQRAIRQAASAREIPWVRLPTDQYWQLGWGSKQRRLIGGVSDRASALSESLVSNQETTHTLLQTVGVPTTDSSKASYSLLLIGTQVVAAVRLDDAGMTDCTTQIPAAWQTHASDAVRVIGLEACGLEVCEVRVAADDVTGPMAVTEIVARPDLESYCNLSPEMAQRIGSSIIDFLFPNNQPSRIPVASVTGTNGKTTTTRLIAHIVALTGKRVGMTCTDGIYISGKRIDHEDCSGPRSARNVLMNPLVDAAVLETARGGMLREGLAFDRSDVSVVMNIGEGDHLGLNDINTPEQLADVKQIIVRAVAPQGTAVLKADDPLVSKMATRCPGSVIFFCRNAEHPVMVQHRAEGGRVVFVRDRFIVLAEGALEIPLLSVDRIPLTQSGLILFQVDNAMAATAANWALGTPAEIIRNGLESFASSMDSSPGRFNLLEIRGATVVVDYGHNTSSLAAMLEALALFPHTNRVAVYSAAGDRRDCDMIRQGEMLGDAFDRVMVYEDHYVRGRAPGEIMDLFQQGLAKGRRVREVVPIQGWAVAAEDALKRLTSGDLLLLQADTIDAAMELIHRHQVTDNGVHEVSMSTAIEHSPSPAPVSAEQKN
ncbi:MAG: Cyanophycin synthetase [Planctomycetota bacterium]